MSERNMKKEQTNARKNTPQTEQKRGWKKTGGFTLLELMAVVGILGVMAAVAVPNYLAWLPKHRLNGAARTLSSDLYLARMKAVSENREFTVKFDVDKNNYSIYSVGQAGETLVKTVDIGQMFKGTAYGYLPGKNNSGKTITKAITFSGKPPKLSFKPSGMSNKSGSIYLMPLKNSKIALQRAITVLITGRIRIYRRIADGWR